MKNVRRPAILLFVVALLSAPLSFAAAQNNGMGLLKDVTDVKTVFDFRMGDPKAAALHLNLIGQMAQELKAEGKNPDFHVVFIGPAVKLVSTNREGFKPGDGKALDDIAKTVSMLSEEGVGLEICLVAARLNNVDPASVLPGIRKIENGWYSVIGYQLQNYALVDVF